MFNHPTDCHSSDSHTHYSVGFPLFVYIKSVRKKIKKIIPVLVARFSYFSSWPSIRFQRTVEVGLFNMAYSDFTMKKMSY